MTGKKKTKQSSSKHANPSSDLEQSLLNLTISKSGEFVLDLRMLDQSSELLR